MARRLATTVVALWAATAPAARAAPFDAAAQAELRRGAAAVEHWTSDEPALRTEGLLHPPSPAFSLGAALGAWINAATTLQYDTTHTTGDGGDAGIRDVDCHDERTVFDHLEARRQGLGLATQEVARAAALADPKVFSLWLARQKAAPTACGSLKPGAG